MILHIKNRELERHGKLLCKIKNISLNEGDIVEQGSHDELLAKDGFYSNLYRSQYEELEGAN